jgi:hypothetical protein
VLFSLLSFDLSWTNVLGVLTDIQRGKSECSLISVCSTERRVNMEQVYNIFKNEVFCSIAGDKANVHETLLEMPP